MLFPDSAEICKNKDRTEQDTEHRGVSYGVDRKTIQPKCNGEYQAEQEERPNSSFPLLQI